MVGSYLIFTWKPAKFCMSFTLTVAVMISPTLVILFLSTDKLTWPGISISFSIITKASLSLDTILLYASLTVTVTIYVPAVSAI